MVELYQSRRFYLKKTTNCNEFVFITQEMNMIISFCFVSFIYYYKISKNRFKIIIINIKKKLKKEKQLNTRYT